MDTEKHVTFNEKIEGPFTLLHVFVPDDVCEKFCINLQENGVGEVYGTGFSVLPTSFNVFGRGAAEEEEEEDEMDDIKMNKKAHKKKISTQKSMTEKKHRIEKFYRSIKSRLIVAEVIKR